MRVLVVEDEEEPADAIARGLRPHAIENVSGRGYRLCATARHPDSR